MTRSTRTGTCRRVGVAGVAIAALVLSGCGQPQQNVSNPSTAPITVQDCGKEVTIKGNPKSVMTIGTDAITLLDAAGAANLITARAGEFGAQIPAGLHNPPTKAKIIDPADPTTEQIIGSGADIVIGYGLFKADVNALEQAGIQTLNVSGDCGHDGKKEERAVDFETVIGDVERFGKVFGTSQQAKKFADEARKRVAKLKEKTPKRTRTAAALYYFSSTSPLGAQGGRSIFTTSMRLAGLESVYAKEPKLYLQASLESLLAAQPEVIIIIHGTYGNSFEQTKKRLLAEPGVNKLPAVTAGRIIGMTSNETSPSPDAILGAEHLVEAVGKLPN